jgi:hypothetical protein
MTLCLVCGRPDVWVLGGPEKPEGFSLKVEPGETVAFVGQSGSGRYIFIVQSSSSIFASEAPERLYYINKIFIYSAIGEPDSPPSSLELSSCDHSVWLKRRISPHKQLTISVCGVGKSTLIAFTLRFYDPENGQVRHSLSNPDSDSDSNFRIKCGLHPSLESSGCLCVPAEAPLIFQL